MRTIHLFGLVSLLLIISHVKLQGQEYHFYQSKTVGDKGSVYFKIKEISSDTDEHDRVLAALLSDSNISDGDIYFDNQTQEVTCRLLISPVVTVNYVRKIIQSTGYDIDLNSVAQPDGKPKGMYFSERFTFHKDFDGMKGYDINVEGAERPEVYYQKNKEEWIKNNPEKYQDAKKENGETVVVKRKDLEFFKEEKRNYILNHPEIFIIED